MRDHSIPVLWHVPQVYFTHAFSSVSSISLVRSDVYDFSHILGVPTQDLLRVPALKDDVQDEIRAQLPYLHLLHWCVRPSVCLSALLSTPVLL